MKVKLRHTSSTYHSKPRNRFVYFSILLLGGIFSVAMGYGGFIYGSKQAPSELLTEWGEELGKQSLELRSAEKMVTANIEALTQRIGLLQAHVSRLDALGSRLVTMAKLKSDEFDFSSKPGVGGAESTSKEGALRNQEITKVLEALELALLEREQQLSVLSERILHDSLSGKVIPEGFPVANGWISSVYGYRTDPFNGKRQFHKGVDIAAANGEIITSVASGIIKLAESHPQYGLEVQVDHGNGYVTRYAHTSTLLVSLGDVVEKGTPLATIGSTGRSTGPHLHFEVIKEGKAVNPMRMLKK